MPFRQLVERLSGALLVVWWFFCGCFRVFNLRARFSVFLLPLPMFSSECRGLRNSDISCGLEAVSEVVELWILFSESIFFSLLGLRFNPPMSWGSVSSIPRSSIPCLQRPLYLIPAGLFFFFCFFKTLIAVVRTLVSFSLINFPLFRILMSTFYFSSRPTPFQLWLVLFLVRESFCFDE